jgi:hypothetical protein
VFIGYKNFGKAKVENVLGWYFKRNGVFLKFFRSQRSFP